jgi:hypothetical protein
MAKPGATSRALDFSSPDDLDFIERFWKSFLAPRQCSATWQCQEFLRHGEPLCVFSTLGYKPWLNGDTPGGGVAGIEGGCNCNNVYAGGFWDFPSSCLFCAAGFGPGSDQEWALAVQYQAALELQFPALGFYPVYDPALFPEPPLCALPVYATSKPTQICAGRGTVELSVALVDQVIQIFPDNDNNPFTPTCTSLLLVGGPTSTLI